MNEVKYIYLNIVKIALDRGKVYLYKVNVLGHRKIPLDM
jgi:hypothetical protein